MGSWNKTCGLSNLHIYSGTPVYVFVLEESRDKTDRCYSTAFWSPLLVPFESEYNDYGGGENSSGIAFELIMKAIGSKLTEVAVGENEYHDIAVQREGFGEEQFFESVHENRLTSRDRLIDFVMFRKDVVDHILENRVIEKYVGDGAGTHGWGNNYITYKFEDVLADIPEFLDVLESKIKESAADESGTLRFQLMHGSFEYLFDYKHPNKASWFLRGDSYRFSQLFDSNDAIMKFLIDNKRSEAEELLKTVLIGKYIDSFMECTRRNWAPAGHEGSQSAEADEHRVLCNAIVTALDVEKAKWDSENDADTLDD
jgi:hypothetical protein